MLARPVPNPAAKKSDKPAAERTNKKAEVIVEKAGRNTPNIFDDDRRIFDAICAGASGYMLKKTPAPRLLQGIRDAAAGGSPMSPEIAARVLALFRQVRPPPVEDHDLTPHEIRVLKLLVDGHNYKTAAVELGVSVNTISFHMRRIYDKLHVHTKSEAVSKALRNQIVG